MGTEPRERMWTAAPGKPMQPSLLGVTWSVGGRLRGGGTYGAATLEGDTHPVGPQEDSGLSSRAVWPLVAVLSAFVIGPVGAGAKDYEIGIAYVYDGTSGVMGSWGHGPALVVGMVDDRPGLVRVDARFSWRPAPFDSYGLPGPAHVPEEEYTDYYGDASHLFRGSLGLRFGNTASAPPYVCVRAGVLVALLGQVEQRVWDQYDPDDTWICEAPGSGQTEAELYIAFGLGAVFDELLVGGLSFELEVSTIPAIGGTVLQGGVFAIF